MKPGPIPLSHPLPPGPEYPHVICLTAFEHIINFQMSAVREVSPKSLHLVQCRVLDPNPQHFQHFLLAANYLYINHLQASLILLNWGNEGRAKSSFILFSLVFNKLPRA